MRREACWTESVTVGSPEFVERVLDELLQDYSRRRLATEATSQAGRLVLREALAPYGAENSVEDRAIDPLEGVKTP